VPDGSAVGRVTLTFIGPASATVRLRRGPPPSQEPVLVERVVDIEQEGTFDVTLSVSASRIDARGGSVIVEVEGVTPQGHGRGGVVGTDTESDCPTVLQNGSTRGVAPNVHLGVRAEVCTPACERSDGPDIIVTPRAPAATGPKLMRAHDDAQDQQRLQDHHREGLPPDSSWTASARKKHGFGALHLGVQGQGAHVDVPGAKLGVGGGAAVYGIAIGTDALGFRAAGWASLGGQTTGVTTRLTADGSVGPALRISETVRLFARAGMQIDSHADNELDTSVFTLPTASTGLTIATSAVTFELAPRAGPALRGTYAPGDELEGRRHHREAGTGLSWGGAAAIVSRPFVLSAAFDRIEQTNALTMLRGFACFFVTGGARPPRFSVCPFGQGWRGRVVGTDVREVTSIAAGLSLGIGDGEAL
jgi:hypothetical protein